MGRPSKAMSKKPTVTTLQCCNCKTDYEETEFYDSNSVFFQGSGKIPYCKNCINEIYTHYVEKYTSEGCDFPEQKAIKRLCMGLNIYYSDAIFDTANRNSQNQPNQSLVSSYFQLVNLRQYRKKNYDTTLFEYEKSNADDDDSSYKKTGSRINKKTRRFWGEGFPDEDYEFLQEQYDDWTTRHECNTKAQEEVFKQICFTQLELLKATKAKQDTKDLTETFRKLLDTAKLQPKQNSSDTMSDAQTFGTLIDKWENTRPLPEIDEQLQDVDKIGLYMDVFFRGHLSKMMGIKNAFSNLYTKFIKKYTVNKPEYDSDDSSEVIFDAIFGNHDSE